MARSIKAECFWVLLLAPLLLACSMFLTPVHASFGKIHEAINFLTQAQNAYPASKQQLRFLVFALRSLNTAFTKGPEKTQAITSVKSAIADAKAKDFVKLKQDITQALAEANAIIPASSESTPPATATQPESAAPTVHLSDDQARAVVLIKGDNGEGTGFLVKTPDGPAVVTNIHVISNNPNLKITTNTGTQLTILSYKGATDRDLAMIAVKDAPSLSYLTLATDISKTVQPGDEVITPGNSEGGEVMLNTYGKVLGIGPDRVEFDNPIYHGNSGGPVFHVKSGQVIGVVSEAIKVVNSDDLDKTSFASRHSAIVGSMRYFGFRLDNVASWEPYNWNRLQTETAFLDKFDLRSRCLDSLLNTPSSTQAAPEKKKHKKKNQDDNGGASPGTDDNNSQDAILWQQDAEIMKANNDYFQHSAGDSDMSQKVDALREWDMDINDIAATGMDAIQVPNSFYAFDELRVKDEIAYRKALQTELAAIGQNVSRMGSLPRTNN